MDFFNFAVNFLVDEVSGDSESDTVGAAAEGAGLGGAREVAVLHGEFDRIEEGDDDRESAVDAGSNAGAEDDGEEVGDDRERDECVGEEVSMRWWSTPEEGCRLHGLYEYRPMKEEEGGEGRISTSTEPEVEDARERDRRFWETCLASGYP